MIMEEAGVRLRSLLFSRDERDVSGDFKKYLAKVLSQHPIDWRLFELENQTPAARMLILAGWGYERTIKKLEEYRASGPKEQKRAERLAELLFDREKKGVVYAYICGTILGHVSDVVRKMDPYKKFYHKIQIKIAKYKPDTGIFPLELNEGEGKRYYSNTPSPDRNNIHDARSASYHSLGKPVPPTGFFLADVYSQKRICSAKLAALALFYHDDIVNRWASFAGRSCFVGIHVFAGWLASFFPDLEGELREKQALEDELPQDAGWMQDFPLAEAGDLAAFERYSEKLWDTVPVKYHLAVWALLGAWLSESEKRVSDTAMATAIGWSPQRFKYMKDKLLDPRNKDVGLLRMLWRSCLTDFMEKFGEQQLGAFMVYFYEFCTNKCGQQHPHSIGE